MSPKPTICTDGEQATTVIQPINGLGLVMDVGIPCPSRTLSPNQPEEVEADPQSTRGCVPRICKICARLFFARARDHRPNAGTYCSRRCACVDKARHGHDLHPQAGSGNYNFKGWASRNKRVYVDRFRAKYPEKAAAHDAVRNALQRGDLVKPLACERCGASVPVQSHHEDYSQPLIVDWFCGDCHRARHRELRHAANLHPAIVRPVTPEIGASL